MHCWGAYLKMLLASRRYVPYRWRVALGYGKSSRRSALVLCFAAFEE